jgi:hypothetical protein
MDGQFVIPLSFAEAMCLRYALHYRRLQLDDTLIGSTTPLGVRADIDAVLALDNKVAMYIRMATELNFGPSEGS